MNSTLRVLVLPLAIALFGASAAPAEVVEARLGERLERLPEAVESGHRLALDASAMVAATELAIELPERTVRVARHTFERRERGDFVWVGRAGSGERVVLTTRAGSLAGTIFDATGTYRIFPTADGGYELLEMDQRVEAGCGVERGALGTRSAEKRLETSEGVPRQPRVDVLVIYTPRTREIVGGKRNMLAVVQHYVDLTNVAFHNSEIGARLRLVGSAEIAPPAATEFDSFGLVEWLRTSDQVGRLRGDLGADLVGVLHDGGSQACGSAAMIYRPGGPGANRAYFESRRLCGAETFAHEVGHLMGGDHDPDNAAVAAGEFIYGRGHLYDGDYRTIMSYGSSCGDACPTQPFFSNPGIRYDGRATGRRERDNARLIDELAADVEAFVPAINGSGGCALEPGDPDYCAECGPCIAGEGNCVEDVDCVSGLTCAANSGGDFGLDPTVDVCRQLSECDLDPGDPDYCRLCGPCSFGDGDCDDNRECQAGLTCLDDVGEIFGLPRVADVCAFRENGFCPLAPGDPNYCEACGPCSIGEGNCKASGQCRGVLTCFQDVGAQFGFSAGTNVCLVSAPGSCSLPPGHPDFCRVCGVCGEGEGDCDAERECAVGLSCVDGAGVAPGSGEQFDACLPVDGGALEAPRKLKAKVLSPSRVRLRWRDKSKNESGFYVEISRAGGPFERIGSTAANQRKLIVGTLESGTIYTFRVQAFGEAGLSDYSNERTITLP